MKLALIRRRFAATGGAELYLQRLMASLVDAGHDVHLYAEAWESAPPRITLHPVPVSGTRAQRPRAFAETVRAEVAKDKFDCVFSLERTLRQDVYRAGDGVHRVWLQRRREFAPWWKRPFIGHGAFHRTMCQLEAEAFNPANTGRVIVNSEMVKREILQHFPFPPDRIHLVRNGVDVMRFQGGNRTETRARFGVKSDEFLLLFVGSGWERKGLKYLLKVMGMLRSANTISMFAQGLGRGIREFQEASRNVQAQLQTAIGPADAPAPSNSEDRSDFPREKIKLLVVGKGARPAGAPDNVIFAGSLPDVENVYAAADLMVFLPIYEPSANIVFEALAAGLPVITSAQNGASELLEERVNGTVVPSPGDIDQVAHAIGYWWSRRHQSPMPNVPALSLERNVTETLAVLELAAKEKRS